MKQIEIEVGDIVRVTNASQAVNGPCRIGDLGTVFGKGCLATGTKYLGVQIISGGLAYLPQTGVEIVGVNPERVSQDGEQKKYSYGAVVDYYSKSRRYYEGGYIPQKCFVVQTGVGEGMLVAGDYNRLVDGSFPIPITKDSLKVWMEKEGLILKDVREGGGC